MLLKKTKKIMSIVLSMLFMVSILPAIPVFADYEGSCGEGVYYSFDQSTGTLTISGHGSMENYSRDNEAPWSAYNESIKSVTIENGVTSIGSYAFKYCIGLTGSLTIPDSVNKIESGAFFSCIGLTGQLTIPDSVTSIGSKAFEGCRGLTSMTIPDSVTEIGAFAFRNCSGLTSITIPSGVTNIRPGVFYGCSGLTSITIPSKVDSIEDFAFFGCSGLSSVTIGKGVTSIGEWIFEDCKGLDSLTIQSSVTEIGCGAFNNCINLTSITYLGNAEPEHGIHIFSDCSKLSSVKVTADYKSDNFCGIPVVIGSPCDVQKVTDSENGSAQKEDKKRQEAQYTGVHQKMRFSEKDELYSFV